MTELLIVFVVNDNVQLMDIAGPADVFAEANTLHGRPVYRSVIAAPQKSIRSSCGFALQADYRLQDLNPLSIDTLLVAGAPDAAHSLPAPEFIQWLSDTAPQARRFGSICGGVFSLAATGLLNNRKITAHWADVDPVRQRFPTITVNADSIVEEDGPVRTAAGVSSGLDLALALVREDLGEKIARDVARQLILFTNDRVDNGSIADRENCLPPEDQPSNRYNGKSWNTPSATYSVDVMAEIMQLERRQLTRLFTQETGLSPAQWVEQTRLAIARSLLESGRSPLKVVAADSGFGFVRTLRRAFQRHLGITPIEYRKRFGHSR